MATYQDLTFNNQSVVVDGNEYEACSFIDCTLTYRGGELPTFVNCSFIGGSISLEDAAYDTVTYLRGLSSGGLVGAVENVMYEVERGNPELALRPASVPRENIGTNWGQLGRISAVLGVVTVLLAAAIWYGFYWYPSQVVLAPNGTEPLFSQVPFDTIPALPESLGEAYNALRANQIAELNGSDWVDPDQRIVRITLSSAMNLIIQNGAPSWPQGE